VNCLACKYPFAYNVDMKRISIITGHYGSGKTEFSLNYALKCSSEGKRTALVDLDIANVYFRSRELQDMLQSKGIQVYGNAFRHEITADLPALAPEIRKPLEDESCYTVVDVGGDESGAKILNQFNKYFLSNNSEMLCIINANRPETSSVKGALRHIRRIEEVTKLPVTGLVNNTHMLRETSMEDIEKGFELCSELSKRLNIQVVYNCYPESLFDNREREIRALSLSRRSGM
jgi:hypothetical protein